MIQVLTIPGNVPTKKNKYRVRGDGKGFFKPPVVKDFEKLVEQELLVQRARAITGPIQVSLVLVYGRHEPDLDGSLTTLLDALQDGGLFPNDRDVRRIHDCEKRASTSEQSDPPRAIITIEEYAG